MGRPKMAKVTKFSTPAMVAVGLFWAGMLVGVSFLATPAKFMAPSLTLPVALEVGRATFAIFERVEQLLVAILLIVAFIGPASSLVRLLTVVLVVCVAIEGLWLLPALDARVDQILAGQLPKPSRLHELYIAIDAAKLVLLGWIVMAQWRRALRLPVARAHPLGNIQ